MRLPSVVWLALPGALGLLVNCHAFNDTNAGVNAAAGGLRLPGVSFQTVLGGNHAGAIGNGGGAVVATATVVADWERFALIDVNDGVLESGDRVFIQAGNGQYLQADNGGGSSLNAAGIQPLEWETFQIFKQTGPGAIVNGDVVGLKSTGGAWVSAQNGGGGPVFAYGGALGSWEQLKISGLSETTPPPPPAPGNPININGVSFRTRLKGTFLGAQDNGGAAVIATATVAQAWETFTLIDVNGGLLNSGDSVFIKAGNGQFFHETTSGGSTLDAAGNEQQASATFKIVKAEGGGVIKTGDVVGLQASSGGWISAENGGGGAVFAYGAALREWESFVIGIGAPAGDNPVSGNEAPPGWRLVWSDEFNGGGLDGSKWTIETKGPGWVNHELQAYTTRPENVRVENGHLVLEGRRDFAGGGEYSSGRIHTAGHASWTYGRMEARIQLPGGLGTWPAFWMMPNDFGRGWPACGEIDIMEEVGFEQDSIHSSTHTARYNWVAGNGKTSATPVGGVTAGYHLYALEWFPDRLDFFVDGRKFFTMWNENTGDDAWPFNKNFYIILNLAIGGDWGGARGVDPNIWPRQMLVDYVRVYQR